MVNNGFLVVVGAFFVFFFTVSLVCSSGSWVSCSEPISTYCHICFSSFCIILIVVVFANFFSFILCFFLLFFSDFIIPFHVGFFRSFVLGAFESPVSLFVLYIIIIIVVSCYCFVHTIFGESLISFSLLLDFLLTLLFYLVRFSSDWRHKTKQNHLPGEFNAFIWGDGVVDVVVRLSFFRSDKNGAAVFGTVNLMAGDFVDDIAISLSISRFGSHIAISCI